MDVNTESLAGSLLSGRFQLGDIIGKGGMGVVFEGVDHTNGGKVAIKCLHPKLVFDKNAVMRFHQEAACAGAISHNAHICEVIASGTNDLGIPYLVMPRLEGVSLESLFQSRLLTLDRLIDIVSQILCALSSAEEAGIVHRDLKPGNIFVTQANGRDHIKLLDFGISKIMHQKPVQKLTRTGAVLGTPHYMSPEQAGGMGTVDHRTDIYATGVILYEGMTGRCPFEGDSYNDVIFKIVTNPFTLPRRINPLIPAPIEQVVLKAMAKDPVGRFSTAKRMRDALMDAARVGVTEARQASVTAQNTTPEAKAFGGEKPATPFEPSIQPRISNVGRQKTGYASFFLGVLLVVLLIGGVGLAFIWHLRREKGTEPAVIMVNPVPRNNSHVTSPLASPKLPKVTIPVSLSQSEETAVQPKKREIKPKDTRLSTRHKASPKAEQKKEMPLHETKPPMHQDTEKKGLVKRGITFEDEYD